MTEQLPMQGPTKADCPDNCGLFGTLKKPFKDGVRHVRGCKCKQCGGRRVKSTGAISQRADRRMLKIPYISSIRTGHEEYDGGTVLRESKSGKQVKPLHTAFTKAEKRALDLWAAEVDIKELGPLLTAYLKAETQSNASRRIGDTRPFLMMARLQPEGKEAIVTFRAKDDQAFRDMVAALAKQLGLFDEELPP
jgi:hypothetical protein